MGIGEASANHGQDEQDTEYVREVPTGHRQDNKGAKDVTQNLGGSRQAPAGHRQSRVGPNPPQAFQDKVDQDTISQYFFCGSGVEYI